jgi:hypothetical protein
MIDQALSCRTTASGGFFHARHCPRIAVPMMATHLNKAAVGQQLFCFRAAIVTRLFGIELIESYQLPFGRTEL